MSKVAVTKCVSYDHNEVSSALDKCLDLIGGLAKLVKPGQRVLLKVNALLAAPADDAVSTHPAIVYALVKKIVALGAKAYVGDCPGNATANLHQVLEVCGIKQAAEAAGGEVFPLQNSGLVEIPSPSQNQSIKTLTVAKAVLEFDVIVNLPKLKTHNMTLYTGAIKNLFGCVPGFHKSKYHFHSPQPSQLSQMLVDLLEIVKPKLNIMDAVWGMEGAGPSNGDKRFFGALMASTDAVALDAVASAAIGFKPLSIAATRLAAQRGLGEAQLEKIEVLGERLESVRQKDWQHPFGINQLLEAIRFPLTSLLPLLTKVLRVDPVIDQNICQKCLICVNNCPAKTIHFNNKKVKIDLKGCIMCFCCHELCPYKAIRLKRSWLAKVIGIIGPD